MRLVIGVDGPAESGTEYWYTVSGWWGPLGQNRVATFREALGIALRFCACTARQSGYREVTISAEAMALPEVREALGSIAEVTA